jgi:hypothetical protein
MNLTYYQWLLRNSEEDSVFENLGKTIYLDKYRPKSKYFKDWEKYFIKMGVDEYFMEIFKESWECYKSFDNQDIQDSKNRNKFKKGLDPWIIQRPSLPNYFDPIAPTVILTLSDSKNIANYKNNNKIKSSIVAIRIYLDAVLLFAKYFRKEFGYDFIPYSIRTHEKYGDLSHNSYLFFEDRISNYYRRPIGACSFDFDLDDNKWYLSWIWFHPYARRRGYLSKAWEDFKGLYGDFGIREPLSIAMHNFIQKMKKN